MVLLPVYALDGPDGVYSTLLGYNNQNTGGGPGTTWVFVRGEDIN